MQINHTRHGEAELTWCVCVCARACVGIQGVGSGKIQRKIFRGRAHRGSVGVFSEHKKDTSERSTCSESSPRDVPEDTCGMWRASPGDSSTRWCVHMGSTAQHLSIQQRRRMEADTGE
jgi:hypothetical protein